MSSINFKNFEKILSNCRVDFLLLHKLDHQFVGQAHDVRASAAKSTVHTVMIRAAGLGDGDLTVLNGDGVVKEWNEQGAAFDAALVGKTGTEIAALESEGYGVESVQTAGCTIAISDMVKAAVKAATVA